MLLQFTIVEDAYILDAFAEAYSYLNLIGPYIFPLVLVYMFSLTWMNWVRAKFIADIDWVLLEIKLPREINKPVSAMELALAVFHQKRRGTWFDRVWKGILRQWFSLELVSIEGRIHFFIYTPRFFIRLVENSIYSQYPEVEVKEVDDYTKFTDYGREDSEWDLFGTEFKLSEEDTLPIKTYVDYQLEEVPRDNKELVDPITPLMELLGSAEEGEQVWIQLLVKQSEDRFKNPKSMFKTQSWHSAGKSMTEKLSKRNIVKPPIGTDFVDYSKQMLTPRERAVVESVERNLSKIAFDCGFRVIYLGKKDKFRDMFKAGLMASIKQFNSEDTNGFKPNSARTTDFDYPWQDFKNIRLNTKKRLLFNAYKKRSYFYPPYKRHPFTLSVEELATIFHFPGSVAETPTFHRIPSRTSQPPTDLPL